MSILIFPLCLIEIRENMYVSARGTMQEEYRDKIRVVARISLRGPKLVKSVLFPCVEVKSKNLKLLCCKSG